MEEDAKGPDRRSSGDMTRREAVRGLAVLAAASGLTAHQLVEAYADRL